MDSIRVAYYAQFAAPVLYSTFHKRPLGGAVGPAFLWSPESSKSLKAETYLLSERHCHFLTLFMDEKL
jgi:hypothetical protein